MGEQESEGVVGGEESCSEIILTGLIQVLLALSRVTRDESTSNMLLNDPLSTYLSSGLDEDVNQFIEVDEIQDVSSGLIPYLFNNLLWRAPDDLRNLPEEQKISIGKCKSDSSREAIYEFVTFLLSSATLVSPLQDALEYLMPLHNNTS